MFKPRLLRETAEIALTEIKRFIEPRMVEEFSLRRVSAPLYLPVSSGLNDPGDAVRFTLPSTREEVEIVRGLDRWLRSQLVRYDIAPGFGVFTVMNAIRPDVTETATGAPHIGAWAWQQAINPDDANLELLSAVGKRLYTILQKTEEMILERFPHLKATLPQRYTVITRQQIAEENPGASPERQAYEYLHRHTNRAVFIIDDNLTGTLMVWNPVSRCALSLADIACANNPYKVNIGERPAVNAGDSPVTSVGGTLYRDQLAMQILHQPHLLR